MLRPAAPGQGGLPIGPSGVAFVRKSHRFVMIRYSPAKGLSELVLLQAEADPGEERILYSAQGDFGTLAMSPNGNWLLVGWVDADQWLFLRLNALKAKAVSNITEQFSDRDAERAANEDVPQKPQLVLSRPRPKLAVVGSARARARRPGS